MDLGTQWLQEWTILKVREESFLEWYCTSCSSFSSFWNCSLGQAGCFFFWVLPVLGSRGSLTTPSNWVQCGKGASSRQEGRPSSLTLTPVCLSCLLTLGMGWDNPGTGAKLVTGTYQSRAESCIYPLLTDLCAVLGLFGVLYFFSSFLCPWPKCFVAKTLLLVKKA